MQSQKQQNDFCSFPWQTIQYHGNPSLCPTSNAEEAEVERFYDDLQNLLELTCKKHVLFIIGDWNSKVGSQEIPGVAGKFDPGVQNEAGQVVWYSHLFQNFPQFIVIHTVQRKPFNITVIQVYALTNSTEEAEVEWFYEDLQDL